MCRVKDRSKFKNKYFLYTLLLARVLIQVQVQFHGNNKGQKTRTNNSGNALFCVAFSNKPLCSKIIKIVYVSFPCIRPVSFVTLDRKQIGVK